MFVKVVENLESQIVTMHECDRASYHKVQHNKPAGDGDYLVVELTKNESTTQLIWDMSSQCQIYLMNSDGKTVDTLMWQPVQEECNEKA